MKWNDWIIIFFLLFVWVRGVSQPSVTGDTTWYIPDAISASALAADTIQRFEDNKPYCGIDTAYWNDDSTEIEVTVAYDEGYKTMVKQFYENGNKHRVIPFKGGLRHGKSTVWYATGELMIEFYYDQGNEVFGSLSWYENGKLKQYSAQVGESVLISEWYPSGSRKRQVDPIVNGGELAVHEVYWYESGELDYEATFNYGKQLFTAYHKTGNKAEEGMIVNGPWSRAGKWTSWYPNGQLMSEQYYLDSSEMPNVQIGTWKYYDESGSLIRTETYQHGQLVDYRDALMLDINKETNR